MHRVSGNGTLRPAPPLRPAIPCDPDAIPAALKECDQWVTWRYIARGGRPTKVPINARTGREASSTDPSTWSSFTEAVSALGDGSSNAGIGFVFSPDDPFCGIDLDDCLKEGAPVPEAHAIVDTFKTYTEVSPSGNGVKLFLQGRKPPWARCRLKAIGGFKETEIYDSGRFFTLTGRRVPGTPVEVCHRQHELEALCGRLWPPAELSGGPDRASRRLGIEDDEDLLVRMFNSRHGAGIRRLWDGDTGAHGGDHSAADLALCNHLAFWTGRDRERMDRMFRRSGLMRPKWDEGRGQSTYGRMTLEQAMSNGTVRCATRQSTPGDAGHCVDENVIPLGKRDPTSGRLVLSPKRTLPTAEAFVAEFHHHREGRTLYSYAGTLLVWRGNRFVEIDEETLRQRLQPWLHDALRYVLNRKTGALEPADFESNPGTVKAAVESIRAHTHLPVSFTPPQWLDDRAEAPDPHNLLPFPSGTLDLSTGRTMPPTPALFNINAIDFDYDPNPQLPERWFRFLEQLWDDDLESVELLREWMGYSLVADTSQQKMLLLVGPRRSGKGTIGRVLTRLVGAGNVVGPTTSSLAGAFGLQPLIGKSLAIVSDARFNGPNVGVVVERLLCISGEDALTVDRKFLGSVTMKLPTRFVFLTNELPRMNDASAALAGRFVILRLTRSFFGEEDTTLTQQLMSELPGILVWAIEGLKRLRVRGHFVQPQSVADAVQDLEDLASPVMAFVRDCCEVGPGHRTWIDEVYGAWKRWCESDGRNTVTSKQVFGRDLAAAVPGVVCRRHSIQGRFYDGVALRDGGAI